MEVSTKNNDSGIELTEEAQELIQRLIVLDSAHHEDKVPFYEQLYEMWKNDVTTIPRTKKRFTLNKTFITETIFNSLSTELKDKMNKTGNIYT